MPPNQFFVKRGPFPLKEIIQIISCDNNFSIEDDFKIYGIEKTTMDEIALESGFGKATLYYYYTSKDEVFIDIMVKGWKDLWEGIESRIVEERETAAGT